LLWGFGIGFTSVVCPDALTLSFPSIALSSSFMAAYGTGIGANCFDGPKPTQPSGGKKLRKIQKMTSGI
jgi:hypothetical protein